LNVYFLFTLLLLLLIVVWIVWRVASRRRSIPCPAWLSWMVDNPFSLRRTAATMQHLELEPGQRVLDGGCGPGRLSIPIAKALGPEGSVLAVDIQSEMIERVRRKAASASLGNIEFLQAGLGDGRLPEGWFDRAVLSTVLGEIPDRLSAMREIYSALKPGGFLLVNEVIGDPHYQSLAKVEALAKEAGYHPSKVHGGRMTFSVKLEKPMNQTRT
jgi:2-polyprenyl-3-methyl-5-hydroxy-6-metoxy-1,4-benzoquinol methylase